MCLMWIGNQFAVQADSGMPPKGTIFNGLAVTSVEKEVVEGFPHVKWFRFQQFFLCCSWMNLWIKKKIWASFKHKHEWTTNTMAEVSQLLISFRVSHVKIQMLFILINTLLLCIPISFRSLLVCRSQPNLWLSISQDVSLESLPLTPVCPKENAMLHGWIWYIWHRDLNSMRALSKTKVNHPSYPWSLA